MQKLYFILLCASLNCCTYMHRIHSEKISEARLCQLSNEAIIQHFIIRDSVLKLEGQSIAPELVFRPALPPLFKYEEKLDYLDEQYKGGNCRLVIPDSLMNTVKYFTGTVEMANQDMGCVSYLSGLLPTKTKGEYVIQRYDFLTDHFSDYRVAAMSIFHYRIHKGELIPIPENPHELGLTLIATPLK